MPTVATVFAEGVDGSKPAASSSNTGYLYFSTDINGGTLYQSTGSAWTKLTPGVSAVTASGLTGATAASRYVGATASGAPASGTFVTGDWTIDQTGTIWICTAGGTPGTWVAPSGGTSSLLLNYIPGTDIASGVSFTADTWQDLTTNQSFTVTNSTKVIAISVSCMMQFTQGSNLNNVICRMVIDSAGTPVNRIIGGSMNIVASNYCNPFAGAGTQYFTGLSAASHTVKLQLRSVGFTGTGYLRPSSDPNTESLTIAVVQLA